MNTIRTDVWKRQGSSVIFGKEAIESLLEEVAMVSLSEFLSWKDTPPQNSPGTTILICGLEALLEMLAPNEAHDFLANRVRPVIRSLQNNWTNVGLVFGFSLGQNVFQERPAINEEVLFLRNDNEEIHLSEGLWDGSAGQDMGRIERLSQNQIVTEGYYVARLS